MFSVETRSRRGSGGGDNPANSVPGVTESEFSSSRDVGFNPSRRLIDQAQFDGQSSACLRRQVVVRVAQETGMAPLPIGLRRRLHDRSFRARMIVADRQPHSVQAAFPQSQQVRLPAAFATGEVHGQHIPSAAPTDTPRSQHGATLTDAFFALPFVAH